MDWLIDLALSLVFRLLKDSIKNPTAKAAWRKAMLKLKAAIELAYGDDAEFGVDRSRLAQLKSIAKSKAA